MDSLWRIGCDKCWSRTRKKEATLEDHRRVIGRIRVEPDGQPTVAQDSAEKTSGRRCGVLLNIPKSTYNTLKFKRIFELFGF